MKLIDAIIEARKFKYRYLTIDEDLCIFGHTQLPYLDETGWLSSGIPQFLCDYIETPLSGAYTNWLIDLREIKVK